MSGGEILHPQDRTSFVIELDQLIDRQARGRKIARRAAGKAGSSAAATADYAAREVDDSAARLSSALYGALDQPERSNATSESVEDPLRDWLKMQAARSLRWRTARNEADRGGSVERWAEPTAMA